MPYSKIISCYKDLLDDINDMLFIVDRTNKRVDYVNKKVLQTLGYTLKEINSIGLEHIRQSLEDGLSLEQIREYLQDHERYIDYAKLLTKDGKEIYIEASIRYLAREEYNFSLVIARDITQRLSDEEKLKDLNKNLYSLVEIKTTELMKSLEMFRGYKEALDVNNIVSKSDAKGIITYVNDNLCHISGYSRSELLGKPHNILRHPDMPQEFFRGMWENLRAKKTWSGTLKNRKKDGSSYWIDTSITPILNEHGKTVELIAIRHDVTARVEQQQQLERVAITDTLTGLGNRYKLFDDLTKEFKTLVLIDIDNFSSINDFYGYEFGDEIIKAFSEVLKGEFSGIDVNLYRLYADEFAILNVDFEEVNCQAAMMHFLQGITQKAIVVGGEEIYVEVSGAISKDRVSPYVTAVMALKHGKSKKEHLVAYDESLSLEKEYQNNIFWNKKVQEAIKDNRIVAYYQGIANNITGELERYETLMRLIDEDGKVVSPFFFLDIAKKTKSYKILTKTMIKQSFLMFKDRDESFSINLDIADILDASTVEFIISQLSSSDIGKQVIFEIVESEEIKDYGVILEFIKSVKKFGCKIAIDDFGSGYSNFGYITKLDADYLKIDGSLIQSLDSDSSTLPLVKAIVSFAKDLGIEVIAEFVKNEQIYQIIKGLGICYSQGYYFSEPKDHI